MRFGVAQPMPPMTDSGCLYRQMQAPVRIWYQPKRARHSASVLRYTVLHAGIDDLLVS